VQFLADESLDMAVVPALRLAGFDVRAVAEERPGTADEDVAALAMADDRILLTEDRDFGRIVYALLRETGGVIYMRYLARATISWPSSPALSWSTIAWIRVGPGTSTPPISSKTTPE